MRYDVKDWRPSCGWVIVDLDADMSDGEGGYDPWGQLCVAGFRSKAAAWRWLRIHQMAKALGVSHGFRLGVDDRP